MLHRSRHATLVHLVLLAGAAMFTAHVLSQVTADALAPLTTRARAPRAVLPQDPLPMVSGPRVAALLGLGATPSGVATPVEQAPPEVPLALLGTLSPRIASVVDQVDGRVRTLTVGERTHEVELREIGHGFITVAFRGSLVRVEPGRNAPSRPPRPAAAGSVTRAEVTAALTDLPTLMQQVQLLPAFVNGAFRGFRVARLSSALLARAGLAQGDILRRVNGLDLGRPENLGQLLAQAPDARRVEVELDRGGQALRLSLSLE